MYCRSGESVVPMIIASAAVASPSRSSAAAGADSPNMRTLPAMPRASVTVMCRSSHSPRRGARNVRGDPGMTRRGRAGETREMKESRTERKGAEAPDERWALGHVTSGPRENLELGT